MDVRYELLRYKRSLLLGSENDPVSISLPPFSSDKRKASRRQGETTVNNVQADSTSADELKPQANSSSKTMHSIQSMLKMNKRPTMPIPNYRNKTLLKMATTAPP